jgi:hypothetical protein
MDKKIAHWYLSFNPTLERSLHGENVSRGVEFSPNVKVSFDFAKRFSGGLEYYAAYGSLNDFDPLKDQEQQFFPAIDLDLGPQWEFNFGVGVGVTRSTDHLLIKCLVGRRFSWDATARPIETRNGSEPTTQSSDRLGRRQERRRQHRWRRRMQQRVQRGIP